jgi:DNA-binding transcriptional regulator YiaG
MALKHLDAPYLEYATIGQRIKTSRLNWGWTQSRLASFLNMNQASVSFWESDLVVPNGSTLKALEILFRLPEMAIETGKGFILTDPPEANSRMVLVSLV